MAALDPETALTLKILSSTAIEDYGITQVYPSMPPLIAPKPSISFIQTESSDQITHDSTAVGELVQSTYQIDCWADSNTTARSVAQLVYKTLHGYKGTVTSGSDSVVLGPILRTGKRLNYESAPQVWCVSQVFAVWYTEA